MQLQRNSWRLWPTASQDAVSCLDAIIKQRQPLCSDTDSSTTQLRTLAHTHTPTHTRTGDVEVGQIGRDEKIVHMMRCHTSYLLFSCTLLFFVTLPYIFSSNSASFLSIFLPFRHLTLFLSFSLYFHHISVFFIVSLFLKLSIKTNHTID